MTLTVRNIIISVVSVVVATVSIVIGGYFLHKRINNPGHRTKVYLRTPQPSRPTSPERSVSWPSDVNSGISSPRPLEKNNQQVCKQDKPIIEIKNNDNPPPTRKRSNTVT